MFQGMHEQFFQDLCQYAGLALIATDEELHIRFWNPAASRMLGGSAEAMVGQRVSSIVPAERRELANRLFERTLSRGDISQFEFPYRSPTGQSTYLAVTISPIVEPQGRTVGISVYIRDVTRRMELEREMADAQKMSALGSMAGQVAHHFNSLLGGILMSLDFVQNSDDPVVLRRAVRNTLTALTRINSMTQALSAFAEGDRSQCPIERLSDTVGRFVAGLEPKLAGRGVRLEHSIQPTELRLPGKRILTVLENLAANALEAMSSGGTLGIELRSGPDPGHVELSVSDTGPGITAENLPHVFEPFFTTKCSTSGESSHPGLGLAVVHGIVRELGGTVVMRSIPGEGAVCTVVLPLQRT